jgi:GH15 family glucan-1,4-alpha-glucosidase
MRTAALVATDGSVDWLCLPRFDSPSVFAAILDDKKGGAFRIAPVLETSSRKQFYWPDTNVLVTRFLSRDGVAEVQDFMPAGVERGSRDRLFRRIKVSRGRVRFRIDCDPRPDYARAEPETTVTSHGACFRSAALTLGLTSDVRLERRAHGVGAEVELAAGESATFVLRVMEEADEDCGCGPSTQDAEDIFRLTVSFWRRWLSRCTYRGRWREMVQRSALALKLLTYDPTGAIVAAPTTSLPEELGGVRNWDYRYVWIRDAAFTLYGLIRIGFPEEALHFMSWLEARGRRCAGADPNASPLQVAYDVVGDRVLEEVTLAHLEGYRGSAPVRIGNAAAKQLQLDIYGELLDAVYLSNKYGAPISYELWTGLRAALEWLAEHSDLDDEGIWETRGGRAPFVYSKLMCWVALDRGLRLAEKRSFPAPRARWLAARDALYEAIMTKGWSSRRGAFVQAFGGDQLDASSLIMPLVFFVSPTDPKMLSTVEAIMRSPTEGGLLSDGLVYRYDSDVPRDGITGREGTFNMCTFWLVEALTRAGRIDRTKLDEARLLFERMLGYANHLGLYGEEIGSSGEALGNFPQALTHLALISAAFNLDRALSS